MISVVQISDTHLRADDPLTSPGWRATQRVIREIRPAIIVHSGDIVREDPFDRADHAFAAKALGELDAEVLSIPGNHDVGDGPPAGSGPDAGLVGAFHDLYGPDRWRRDLGDWRLIGINSLVFGTSSIEEADHWRWLEEVLIACRDAAVAIFMHKPPFLVSPSETGDGSATLPRSARRRFWALVAESGVRLVACGHRHEYRVVSSDGVMVVWAPTTSALLDERSPPFPPRAHAGMVEYLFDGPVWHHRFVPLTA